MLGIKGCCSASICRPLVIQFRTCEVVGEGHIGFVDATEHQTTHSAYDFLQDVSWLAKAPREYES